MREVTGENALKFTYRETVALSIVAPAGIDDRSNLNSPRESPEFGKYNGQLLGSRPARLLTFPTSLRDRPNCVC